MTTEVNTPTANYLAQVRAQYENYPYPKREPANEANTLIHTGLDQLALLNDHGFGGRRDFSSHFRVLVAGGGTGDAVVYLAEQLRDTEAEIVYLDISEASMDIAKARLAARGLDNVQWQCGSILDVPAMGLGKFDYINCSGVLHHLADRSAGLAALNAVLADDGVMGIMVYSRQGREAIGIYRMQAMMRMIEQNQPDVRKQVAHTEHLLDNLPPSNVLNTYRALFDNEIKKNGDIGIFDMFLHSQDEPFGVMELYDWLAGCGLSMVNFVYPMGCRVYYDPATFIREPEILAQVQALPREQQQEIADLISHRIPQHSFYAARQPQSRAQPGDDMVPFFYDELVGATNLGQELAQMIADNPIKSPVVKHRLANLTLQPSPLAAAMLARVDGHTPLRDIYAGAQKELADKGQPVDRTQLEAEFVRLFKPFNDFDMLLLRHEDVPAFKGVQALHDQMKPDAAYMAAS